MIDSKPDNVKFDHNDRDGYFLKTTSRRGETIARKIGKQFIKNTAANACRILSDELDAANDRLRQAENDIHDKVRDAFIQWCENTYKDYQEIFSIIIRFISSIDMIMSQGKVCKENCYKRPVIEHEMSFFSAKDLRHPIIEKINQEILYEPNDVELDGNGILLYGLNGGGKSSLLKAVGLAIVMAQMGMFVPAESFHYYPFKTLYTRILGNDNIFRGLSSFALEMTELRTILEYANERSLILGDEICRGTEIHSALSIVGSAVNMLCKKRTNFLFATHLHKLHDMNVVKECDNLRHFYIDLRIENNKLVYSRKIIEGKGRTLYGLEVAEHIVENDEFYRLATQVREQLMREEGGECLERREEIVATKKSSYNSELYVDRCEICKKAESQGVRLEVHHINSQKYADCDGTIDYYHKNHRANLVVLCEEHHGRVHRGDLVVNGWKSTLEGVRLDWGEGVEVEVKVHVPEKKKVDVEEELKERIKGYKYLMKTQGIRFIVQKIQKDLKVEVSQALVKRIFDEREEE